MSLGFETAPLKNPNVCSDPYAPSFWLGKPGALTQIRMPDAGWSRPSNDDFSVHNLLDGQSVDRSPYVCRVWQFQHQWLKPDVMSVLMEYATRQRGIGPFILIDPQMKNLLTPNQASGTDALHTSEGFISGYAASLESYTTTFLQGERSLKWSGIVPDTNTQTQYWDEFAHSTAAFPNVWGLLDSGQQSWVNGSIAGPVTGYGISSQIAFMTIDTANVYRSGLITAKKDGDMVFSGRFNATPTGAAQTMWFVGRLTDSNNYYAARVLYTSLAAHTLTFQLVKRVGGSLTTIGTATTRTDAYVNGAFFTVELRIVQNQLKMKFWMRDTEVKPTSWQAEETDSDLTTGTQWGVLGRTESGNTNTSMIYEVDNFSLVTYQDDVLDLVAPTNLYGWCLPPGATYAFSGNVRAVGSTATVYPQVVQFSASGLQIGSVSGTGISAVSGSWQSFCVTGVVPAGTTPYLRPRIAMIGVSYDVGPTLLVDKLQFELTPTGQCSTWEYGQGQPLVGVRSDSETVPRILRTSVGYIAVEVT